MDYMLWESAGQFKRGLLMPGIEVLLGGLALGGSTVSPDEKSSLKQFSSVYLYTDYYRVEFLCK